MKKIKLKIIISFVLILISGIYYFEYMPEVDIDFNNAPVSGMKVSKINETKPLTTKIANPAGISYNYDDNTYLVSTDDRIFAEIEADFDQVLSSVIIVNKPHNIGDTEGVAYLGNGKAATVGENGVVILLSKKSSGQWHETQRFVIKGFNTSTQLGSAAYDKSTNTLYSAQKKAANKVLYAINLETHSVKISPLTLGIGLREKPGEDWSNFYIAGLDFNNGQLFGVSEAFSSILTIELNGVVSAITGIKGLNESSGITHNNQGYVLIGDAEGYLPDPPIYLLGDL